MKTRHVGLAALATLLLAGAIGAVEQATATGLNDPDPTPTEIRTSLARLGLQPKPGDRSYKMPSSSMEPTLHCARPGVECLAAVADRVVARPYAPDEVPRRGDLVPFLTPPLAKVRCGAGGIFVKRIIGRPGDTVSERNGFIYINARRLSEPYVRPDRRDDRTIAALKIPPRHFYLLGDNRSASCDSRSWGTVPRNNIIGRVYAIYWPPKRARVVP